MPPEKMTMRLETSSASSWSWVTKRVVTLRSWWRVTSHSRSSCADLGVHGAEGLIEQEHARFGGQGAGDGDALALAAGELVGVAAVQALQAEEAEQLRHARPDVGRFPFLDLQPEGDVVGRRSCS